MRGNSDYGDYGGRWPATVKSYDAAKRTCRVDIPGITDGADQFPSAEIEYPIGDKSKHDEYATEIEMLEDDAVWIAFIGNDPRYPIITGYRNSTAGHAADARRRFHHAKIELNGDDEIRLVVGDSTLVISASGIKLTASRIDLN